jgi:hypothetical protein
VPVGVRRQRRHFADQPDDLLAPARRIGDIPSLRVERGKRRHRADQNAHWMCVMVEPVHELLHVLVRHGVCHDLLVPIFQLIGRREFAMQQQIRHLQE